MCDLSEVILKEKVMLFMYSVFRFVMYFLYFLVFFILFMIQKFIGKVMILMGGIIWFCGGFYIYFVFDMSFYFKGWKKFWFWASGYNDMVEGVILVFLFLLFMYVKFTSDFFF